MQATNETVRAMRGSETEAKAFMRDHSPQKDGATTYPVIRARVQGAVVLDVEAATGRDADGDRKYSRGSWTGSIARREQFTS
jgi:hypothetical protein